MFFTMLGSRGIPIAGCASIDIEHNANLYAFQAMPLATWRLWILAKRMTFLT
jgi:hypothetical protein